MLKWKITPYFFYLLGSIFFVLLMFNPHQQISMNLWICSIISICMGLLIILYQYLIEDDYEKRN